ncbi:MAG: dihydroorotate dehydrogenase electron transfer subunit [Brevinematales bacterium]|nr:dihydroorotate dehydrogenase electron transfer subunit [Brevinematales bacterium]
MKFQEDAKIVEKRIFNNYLYLSIETKNIANNALPGQFVNLRVNSGFDPFLRRPFSISDVEGDIIKLFVLIKGRGTNLLAEKREGDIVNIIGPLGNSFPIFEKESIFVAGGIGVAPFLFLARYVKSITLLFGIRDKSFLPDIKMFSDFKVILSSDDGSIGEKGTVLDLLVKEDFTRKVIYACGPNPLFRALNKIFLRCKNVEAYYSLENYMACGFGACKGCAIETINGNKLVCKDGPIFKWNEVLL